MRYAMVFMALLLVGACATEHPMVDREAVDDFVAVRQPEETDAIRINATDDTWYQLNQYYVIYQTRRGDYLFEFSRRCWELDEQHVVADRRWDASTLRARFDTLRGCRVDKIYEVTETDVIELKDLGNAPGSRD